MSFQVRLAVDKAYRAMRDNTEAKQVIVYNSPKSTVKLTRIRRFDKRSRGESFVLTIGSPCYRAREFIKLCKKAGEPFPVRKVQLKMWPKPKKGKN